MNLASIKHLSNFFCQIFMMKCDRCDGLLTMVRVHKNRTFCDNCKAWLSWAIIVE